MERQPIHVLVVEDNPADVRVLRESLAASPHGVAFRVTEAARLSGVAAAVAASGAAVDVVLADLGLPDSSGVETIEGVRALLPGVPVVVLTGRNDENVGLESLRRGAQDFFVKDDFARGSPARAILYAIERRRTHSLELAVERARAADRAKDLYLAMVTHDLRAPLGVISIWADVMRRRPLSPGEQRDVGDQLHESAREQAHLIDDLLDAARLAEGTMSIAREWLDVADLAADYVARRLPVAESEGIALTLAPDGADGGATVVGDPDRLRQVLSNLVSNAMKFTPSGGHVRVAVRRRLGAADVVELSVSDDGRGIDPTLLPHVFDRFRQCDESAPVARAGLGLGLWIARAIVELHGGSLDADSEGLGRGATFTARLPAAPVVRPEPALLGPTVERDSLAASPSSPDETSGRDAARAGVDRGPG